MKIMNRHVLSLVAAAVAGLCAAGGAQAAKLTCGNSGKVHITTTGAAGWSTDARNSPSGTPAAIVDNYAWGAWIDPTTVAAGAKWLSFGVTGNGNPLVSIQGDRANGAWVTNRGTFIYNETITIGPEVDLASIKITGKGAADDNVNFAVKPSTLPGGVANNAAQPWIRDTAMLGATWSTSGGAAINLDGSTAGLGFYYGDNTIGLSIFSQYLNNEYPGGVVADFDITADCLTDVPAQPAKPYLVCEAGKAKGDTVKIGPFYTTTRDWKWQYRTRANAAGTAADTSNTLEYNAAGWPLFEDYSWAHQYAKPGAATPALQARWLSPGTTDPAAGDLPGVPYPLATGLYRTGYNASVFTMNNPIWIGSNINLAAIKIKGSFGFDNTGDTFMALPQGQSLPTNWPGSLRNDLPDGWTAFNDSAGTYIQGFAAGYNQIGMGMLSNDAFRNDCAGGACAMAAFGQFYIEGACTGDAPVNMGPEPAPVPTLDIAGLGLLSLLGAGAGAGALALRRRKRGE